MITVRNQITVLLMGDAIETDFDFDSLDCFLCFEVGSGVRMSYRMSYISRE